MSVTFEEGATGSTDLTMQMEFASSAQREHQEGFGAVAGARQTLDRLADHLAEAGVA